MSSFATAPATAAAASTATATDQVTINVEPSKDQLNINNEKEIMSGGLIAVDGRHSSHRSHGNNHSNHNHHSGESDTDEKKNGRRHRRRSRSRSRSHSPSNRPKRANETGAPHTDKDIVSNSRDVEPLLVTEVNHKKHTELDEESDEGVTQHEQNPGVDDGFFVGNRDGPEDESTNKFYPANNTPHDQPFPYAPGFNPNVLLEGGGNPQIIPDINVYQQKKNLAQGMMDLALLSANANQLRYVVETYARHPYYWFSLISISISLILQVAVGVGLILNSRYNVKNKEQICRADRINNFTVIGIFLITAVNVFITAFGVAPSESRPN